jgi:hypothetical protein
MSQKTLPGVPETPDFSSDQRVNRWICRWHGGDFDADDLLEIIVDWPSRHSLAQLLKPSLTVSEENSPGELARLVLGLISLVERNIIGSDQARGAFRLACMYLCRRGLPFEETAKGNEAALRFHFLAATEFGDPENVGYTTDFSELRLLARQLIDTPALVDELLAGEFPGAYRESYVVTAGYLNDKRLVPPLVKQLSACDDSTSVASVIQSLGRIGDEEIVPLLAGYAYSMNEEIASSAAIALETIGGEKTERVLADLDEINSDGLGLLAAHVKFALVRLREGNEALRDLLIATAAGDTEPMLHRLCALERLSGSTDAESLKVIASLLDDPASGEFSLDTLGEMFAEPWMYSVRDAAFLALLDCRINDLVDVLGEGILQRLEIYNTNAELAHL